MISIKLLSLINEREIRDVSLSLSLVLSISNLIRIQAKDEKNLFFFNKHQYIDLKKSRTNEKEMNDGLFLREYDHGNELYFISVDG